MQADTCPVQAAWPRPSPVARRFHMVLPATPLAVRQTVQDAALHVRRASCASDLVATVELVLAEAMNNIVEHAQAGRADGVIELVLRLDDLGIHCLLRDDGAAMPGGGPPPSDMPDPGTVARADLPEGGFGWPMIAALCLGVRYARRAGWNETELTLAADPAQPRPTLA